MTSPRRSTCVSSISRFVSSVSSKTKAEESAFAAHTYSRFHLFPYTAIGRTDPLAYLNGPPMICSGASLGRSACRFIGCSDSHRSVSIISLRFDFRIRRETSGGDVFFGECCVDALFTGDGQLDVGVQLWAVRVWWWFDASVLSATLVLRGRSRFCRAVLCTHYATLCRVDLFDFGRRMLV